MKSFNLSEWLKNKSRKVTTRLGNREVRIICWDRKSNNNRPIISLMIDPDGNEYTTFHTKNGFVDEKERYSDKRDLFFADEEEEVTEFEKAITKEVEQKAINHTYAYQNGYENGKYDALKDLPKWKKITQREQNYLLNGYLSNGEYYLSIQELKDKLPKEE